MVQAQINHGKKKRIKSIGLFLNVLLFPSVYFSSYTFAGSIEQLNFNLTNVVNSEEQAELNSINLDWDRNYQSINMDETLSFYNNNLNQLDFVETVISNNELIIKDNLSIFTNMILSGNYDDDLSSILKSKSAEQKINFEKRTHLKKQIASLDAELEGLRVKLKVINEAKNKGIIALYEKIKNRIISEANAEHTIQIADTTHCDEYQSIMSCLKKQKTTMKEQFKRSIDVPLNVSVNSFTVLDATQSMSGDLNYDAKISYSLSYNKITDDIIRDLLNLNKFTFTLSSTHQGTKYYIDNLLVGSGKELQLSGDYSGVYDVRAEFSGKSQSLKMSFTPDENYFFPFGEQSIEKIKGKYRLAKKKVIHSNTDNIFLTSINEKNEIYLLSKNGAKTYCQALFDSFPADTVTYQYLQDKGLLVQRPYWKKNGELYSAHISNSNMRTDDKFPIVCVIDIFQRTPVLSMETH